MAGESAFSQKATFPLNETTEEYPANVSQMYLYVEDSDITFSKCPARKELSDFRVL